MQGRITWGFYSHSSYSDLWDMFINQAVPNGFPLTNNIAITDYAAKDDDISLSIMTRCTYEDSDTYPQRILKMLDKVESEFFIYFHEDMILYDQIDMERINKYLNFMSINKGVDWIKLINGGEDDSPYHYHYDPTLSRSNGKYPFAVQPTIFRTSSLKSFLENNRSLSIWELEEIGESWCRENGIVALYVNDHGKKRGMHHYDSKVIPYIATAIVKGKWNWFEYEDILPGLIDQYGIDRNQRGIV